MSKTQSGSEIFIVDNSERDWKVREYLKEWSDISHQFDIATGYFEIGSLLSLDGNWQKLDKIRILMGDEITRRTKKSFVDALKSEIANKLDNSIESEKEKNDFLKGVPAIVEALAQKKIECRVLVSTDVLAEGLNLQDATRLINYDLHWNPVRLMQRIGRVDRRFNNEIEDEIRKEHPDQVEIRGTVVYWNFLPPDELDSLLNLYTRVSNKVLKISRVFGIEGKKLLKPEDDYEALKDFNHELEGDESPLEKLHLEYQELLTQFPELDSQLTKLPNRIFSGKKLPDSKTRAVFFCYELPEMPKDGTPETSVETNGNDLEILPTVSRWYLYNLETEQIEEDTIKINEIIRCSPDTPRFCVQSQETLVEIRQKIEKYLKNGYLKRVQAPIGTRPILKAWMEIS